MFRSPREVTRGHWTGPLFHAQQGIDARDWQEASWAHLSGPWGGTQGESQKLWPPLPSAGTQKKCGCPVAPPVPVFLEMPQGIATQRIPTFLPPGTGLVEDGVSTNRVGVGNGFGKMQAHCIYRALYFRGCCYIVTDTEIITQRTCHYKACHQVQLHCHVPLTGGV